MEALISGHLGIAILIDGDSFLSIDVHDPNQVIAREVSEVYTLLSGVNDVEVYEQVTIEQIRKRLDSAHNEARSLDLVLISLDSELSEETRTEAIVELQIILEDDHAVRGLENILFSTPLPSTADVLGAVALSRKTWASTVQSSLKRLAEARASIKAVHTAWESIQTKSFRSIDERANFHRIAIREGLFRDLTLLINEEVGISSFISTSLLKRSIRDLPNSRVILQQWVAPFVKRPETSEAQTNEEIEGPLLEGLSEEIDRTENRVSSRPMRIAILGTRGIPASYSGYETFVENLSTRLVARGHDVTVYCRSHYVSPRQLEYRGVRLKVLPTIRHKYFDTIVHTWLSALHATTRAYDVALICSAGNAPFAPILRAAGIPVAINVDGLEHKRRKWNWFGQNYFRVAERLAIWLTNQLVTDARVVQDYYRVRYNASSTMIAYGADVSRSSNPTSVRRWGVEPNRYILYASPLDPENNADLVIEAFRRVRTPHKLLIVGDAPYSHEYIAMLRDLARGDRRIVFTGFVFGDAYRDLMQNAYCYVHATEVGGTQLTLLDAMGYGNCVLTLATPENVEAVGEAGIHYLDAKDLTAKLQQVLRDGAIVNQYRQRAQQRVRERYNWEHVVDCYESLFAEMIGLPTPQTSKSLEDVRAGSGWVEWLSKTSTTDKKSQAEELSKVLRF